MVRRTRDILRSEQGVSIVFAVLLVVVLLILGGIIVSFGYANYHRSLDDMAAERTYQNVSSATRLLHDKADGAPAGTDWIQKIVAAGESGGQTPATIALSVSSSQDAQFANISVDVKKNGQGAYNVALYETDAPDKTALQFTLTLAGDKTSVGPITKVAS